MILQTSDRVASQQFISKHFRDFYSAQAETILAPDVIKDREFAFLLLEQKMMIRHKRFLALEELRRFVCEIVPAGIYYSAAYYEDPTLEMEKKSWKGADLIFDIDADHLDTSCKAAHDRWTCVRCSFKGGGKPPDTCPNCSSPRFNEETWFCDLCLERAKDETIKLIEVLTNDLGFSWSDLRTVFSGHRGFHVHVLNKDVTGLSDDDRKEIVDYLTGTGLDLNSFLSSGYGRVSKAPKTGHPGWSGRIAKALIEILTMCSPTEFEQMGLTKQAAAKLLELKEKNYDLLLSEGIQNELKGIGPKTWTRILELSRNKASVLVDSVVTTDIHRLIRLPGSLNHKTGLRAVSCKPEDLDRLDPLGEAAIPSEKPQMVFVTEAPEFRLGDTNYGPYHSEKVSLYLPAALLLVCKGRATPVAA